MYPGYFPMPGATGFMPPFFPPLTSQAATGQRAIPPNQNNGSTNTSPTQTNTHPRATLQFVPDNTAGKDTVNANIAQTQDAESTQMSMHIYDPPATLVFDPDVNTLSTTVTRLCVLTVKLHEEVTYAYSQDDRDAEWIPPASSREGYSFNAQVIQNGNANVPQIAQFLLPHIDEIMSRHSLDSQYDVILNIVKRYPELFTYAAPAESPSYNVQTYRHTVNLMDIVKQVVLRAHLIYVNADLFEVNLPTWDELENLMSIMCLYAHILQVMSTSGADPITVEVLNRLCDSDHFPPAQTRPVITWLFPLHAVIDMYTWVNHLRPSLPMPTLIAVTPICRLDYRYRLSYCEAHVPVVPAGGSGPSDDSEPSENNDDNDDFDRRKTQLTTTTETSVQRPSTSGTTDTSAKRKADSISSDQESGLDSDDPKRSRTAKEVDKQTTQSSKSKEKEYITIIDLCETQNCVFHTMKYMMQRERIHHHHRSV
jgi:hypothetical protein